MSHDLNMVEFEQEKLKFYDQMLGTYKEMDDTQYPELSYKIRNMRHNIQTEFSLQAPENANPGLNYQLESPK